MAAPTSANEYRNGMDPELPIHVITNQEELDQAVQDRPRANLVIDAPFDQKSPNTLRLDKAIYQNFYVVGNTSIEISGKGFDMVSVYAEDHAAVFANGSSRVFARGNARVAANDDSRIIANENAAVLAGDRATVVGLDDAVIHNSSPDTRLVAAPGSNAKFNTPDSIKAPTTEVYGGPDWDHREYMHDHVGHDLFVNDFYNKTPEEIGQIRQENRSKVGQDLGMGNTKYSRTSPGYSSDQFDAIKAAAGDNYVSLRNRDGSEGPSVYLVEADLMPNQRKSGLIINSKSNPTPKADKPSHNQPSTLAQHIKGAAANEVSRPKLGNYEKHLDGPASSAPELDEPEV